MSKPKSNTVKKIMTFSQEGWEKIVFMKEKLGLLSEAEVVRTAVSFMYRKENPDYVKTENRKLDRMNRSPEEKASEKVEIVTATLSVKEQKAKSKQDALIENGERICNELRGKETKDGNGNRKCTFRNYLFVNPQNASVGEKTMYLDELTDDEIENQYMDTVTNEPCPADQVLAALVDLGITDNKGNPL